MPNHAAPTEWENTTGRVATRTAVRFPLRLALRLLIDDATIDAVSKDVSANGILFSANILPKIGSTIEFTMNMPAHVIGLQNDVAIHCFGRVIRHQHDGDQLMAAAVIDEYFLKA